MPDFHQPGSVTSLPQLTADAGHLEADLAEWTRERPLALLLPCHVRDLDSPALAGTIELLRGIQWLSHVSVGIDGANASQFAAAREKFSRLPQSCEVLWNDNAAPQGKGRNLWKTAGHLLRRHPVFAVAMHDCDIRTYSRGFLARLCWPVLNPSSGLRACKGYYARSTEQLHGRVFRLLLQPLLRAWRELLPSSEWPAFLQSLRYPLSGELCVEAGLLGTLAFDPGWGVEIRLLHSLFRNAGPHSICQAELCPSYDHKHQDPADLAKMAEEVARTLWMTMHEEGAALTAGDREALVAATEHHAARSLQTSMLTAHINGMGFDAAAEAALAAQFGTALRRSLSVAPNPECVLPPVDSLAMTPPTPSTRPGSRG